MEARHVRVSVHGKLERLPTHIAAERMVERYGGDVYTREALGKRSAFLEFWQEVDDALAARLGAPELRRRVCALVGEVRLPDSELLDILRSYGALGAGLEERR